MAENSKIQWTHHTFNPWSGCSKVSEGCANCYAADNYSVKIRGVKWGPNGNRIVKAESGWKEPLKWDRAAKAAGERHRVFCASLADVFEDWTGPMLNSRGEQIQMEHIGNAGEPPAMMTMDDVRTRLFRLIDTTPNLDWLLLTKRPENVARMWLNSVGNGEYAVCEPPFARKNVWLGTSVENQEQADKRIPHLLRTPAAVRFLSAEPLLGPLDLSDYLGKIETYVSCMDTPDGSGIVDVHGIDWAIIGGESGHKARPCNVEWIRSLVSQCKAAGVACFVKQLGSKPITAHPEDPDMSRVQKTIRLKDSHGGDPSEWPEDLRVREMPAAESRS